MATPGDSWRRRSRAGGIVTDDATRREGRDGTLIVVDCEAPFGVGARSVGDMTEFGAVDFNALREGRTETFHGTDCSEETFSKFRELLEPRKPVVFVSDNPPTTSSGSTSTSGVISARTSASARSA